MDVERMAREAKERIRRSIGQRSRWAKADLANMADHLRAYYGRSFVHPVERRLDRLYDWCGGVDSRAC